MKKYELTDETMTVDGVTYHRIRACKDFDVQGCHVKAGDLGGYVESERNIDQDENAWVGGNAMVSGNAWVNGNALVDGNAWVGGNTLVSNNAVVIGSARLCGNAEVMGSAQVRDHALVSGNAIVRGNARVGGDVWVGDNAEVGGNAMVSGNAVVIGSARVYGNACVSKSDHIIVIGPIGSRNDYTTFFRSKDNDIIVKCGCFNGNISEFLKKVNETHGDNKYAVEYRAAIEIAKIHIDLEGETE